jgi:serine/threonine protein phosphatase PrpC
MPAPRFVSHGLTHVGLVRRRNEDAYLDRPERGLWAVADGMGGHQAGDYASARIMAALDALAPAADLTMSTAATVAALNEVDAELRGRAAGLDPEAVIASTVVVLLAAADEVAVLWAGDSRLYRWRAGGFARLTTDHSHVQELVEAGTLRPDEMSVHPLANIVTRAIGAGPVEIASRRENLVAGDRFILCSDGLTGMVADNEIAGVIAANRPADAAARLRDIVLARGAVDNLTIVAIETTR